MSLRAPTRTLNPLFINGVGEEIGNFFHGASVERPLRHLASVFGLLKKLNSERFVTESKLTVAVLSDVVYACIR